jgi:hypothetical protein
VIVAIDPGRCTGWCITDGGGCVYDAGITSVDLGLPFPLHGTTLVIEVPQVYRAAMSKGDPNDLIKVAIEVGRWIERARIVGAEVIEVHPATWKGQIPKEVHHARILRELRPEELARLSRCLALPATKRHNALDAVGLALWRVGRGK